MLQQLSHQVRGLSKREGCWSRSLNKGLQLGAERAKELADVIRFKKGKRVLVLAKAVINKVIVTRQASLLRLRRRILICHQQKRRPTRSHLAERSKKNKNIITIITYKACSSSET